jgi:hypothetical protein
VCTSYWCDREVIHIGYRCVEHALPYGVVAHAKYGCNVQICACEVVWMVYNNRKLVNFCDILYCLKVIFLQCVFEALNNVFSYSKTQEQRVYQGTLYLYSSNERAWREISNGVNRSSNRAFMRKLQSKQWRVNFKTQLTSKGSGRVNH